MKKLILASNNAKKLKELKAILSDMDVDILSQREAGCNFEVDETGTTFAENAYLKAKAVFDATGEATVADDSGLMVDALNGEPGVYSARYCGKHGDDEANIQKLLKKLEGVPEEKRAARFVSVVCVCFPDGRKLTVDGKCEGKIGFEKHGDNGFGYDPVFMVGKKSFAELSADEKDKISHRGNALRKLAQVLPEYLK